MPELVFSPGMPMQLHISGMLNIFSSTQVVFLGLEIVIPLVTGELLQFPKLVRSFFSLMSYMMEIYPEHVASLPGTACKHLAHLNLLLHMQNT